MNSHGVFWDAWWPQWRSHWRVLHAWPLSAQAVLLTGLSLLMSLWLSWQISGEAWLTWWQADVREDQARQQLQDLQQQVAQHQARVVSLQAMAHPSGQDWPAWVTLPPNGAQPSGQMVGEVLASTGVKTLPTEGAVQPWQASLPALLAAWQNHVDATPTARITAFVLRPDATAKQLSLQLQSREDAAQVVSPNKQTQPALMREASPALSGSPLYNPFDASGLSQGLPTPIKPRTTRPVPLPEAELSQWQWLGALNAPGSSSAWLRHEGKMYRVSPGQALGADGGEVVQINTDHLLLHEWWVDARGQWQLREVRWPAKVTP